MAPGHGFAAPVKCARCGARARRAPRRPSVSTDVGACTTARLPAHPEEARAPVAQAIGLPLEWKPGMKPTQLPLFSSRAADRAATLPAWPEPQAAASLLAERIGRLLREPVDVHLTDNAWTMVSFKRLQGRVRFRLHHMFSAANDDVVRALAGFTGRNRRTHGRAIDAYIRAHRDLIRPACDRAAPALEQRGRLHDL